MSREKLFTCTLVALSLLFFSQTAWPTIHEVPGDYTTLQSAIDASSDGDTVLAVLPAVYYGNINFNGHNIVLGSLFLITGDTSYVSGTILDGASSGRVVTFESGEDSTALIAGFTIRHGIASFGGGICCKNADPTIRNVIIIDNESSGIGCYNAHPKISDALIMRNNAGFGGGIYGDGSVIRLNRARVEGNHAIWGGGIGSDYGSQLILTDVVVNADTASQFGGGICCWGSLLGMSLKNCQITDNIAGQGGGGIHCYSKPLIADSVLIEGNNGGDEGGGMVLSSGTINNTIIQKNTAAYGAGVLCNGGVFSNCVFSENSGTHGGGVYSGGSPTFLWCTFSSNSAYVGGGLYGMAANFTVENCTFYGNKATGPDGACISGSGSCDLDVRNSIIAFSTHGEAVFSTGDSLHFQCCDIYGNAGGDWVGYIAGLDTINGNISDDPLFCDPENGDLHLRENSPCAPFSPPNDSCDLIGAWPAGCTPTPVVLLSFQATGGRDHIRLTWMTASEIDCHRWEIYRSPWFEGHYTKIGQLQGHGSSLSPKTYQWVDREVISGTTYYYKLKQIDYDGTASWSSAVWAASAVHLPQGYSLKQNYPNPFNPMTNISYAIPMEGHVTLKVYNVRGAEVVNLVDSDQKAGFYSVLWNGNDVASGVYFCRMTCGQFEKVIKMLLIK